MTSETMQTAIQAYQSRSRLAHAMDRLLHNLKPFMRAYPDSPDIKMPDHDMAWVTGIRGDPRQVIAEAVKASPALWVDAVPDDVILVPKSTLAKISGLGPDVIDYLSTVGMHAVENHAARYAQDLAERNQKPDWEQGK